MEVKTIGVIGAGAMGRGIAYAAAFGGYRTILEDVAPEMLEQGLAYIREALDDGVARCKVTPEQRARALANLTTSSSVEDVCRETDLLIEAVPEEMEVKLEIFTIFDKFAKPNAILASNTSSLSVTEMAAITFRPEKCIGMHFFNPVPKMKLLEIVRALETSEATVRPAPKSAAAWARKWWSSANPRLHHQPHQRDDRQRSVLHARGRHGHRRRYRQSAEARPESSDGPIRAGGSGRARCALHILEYLHKTLGEKYRPSPLLLQYVNAGRLGRKSGRGVYDYNVDGTEK